MKGFSFIHAADLHLGYQQYGLESRREDFDRVFEELVDRAIELKPDFVVMAGDIFHHPRPSNVTLENAVKNLSRLREAGIVVLAVDGSHDSAPNAITGTILNPLDSAGLIYYLPRHEGACWTKPECCYVYGVPNYRTRHRTEEQLSAFMDEHKPTPNPALYNIFVLHMALDLPEARPPYIEAEASPELIPDGFNYYAAGHIHETYKGAFKTGLLVYSGCTETVDYEEAEIKKGFHYIKVDEQGESTVEFVQLDSSRGFIILEEDFSGLTAPKITQRAVQLVKDNDLEGVIIVPVLKGTLPPESSRAEVDVAQIRGAGERALFVHPVVQLRESEVAEELVRSIFESEFKDLKTKSFEYFLQVFSERYSREEAQKIAHTAVDMIEPLTKKQEEKTKQVIEELAS